MYMGCVQCFFQIANRRFACWQSIDSDGKAETRDAVYTIGLGWQVDAFDLSAKGETKHCNWL
jgi:hypothetical protein